jgi:hypothetical protein
MAASMASGMDRRAMGFAGIWDSVAACSTALVKRMGFSNPTITTRIGRHSERRIMEVGTPQLAVTFSPKNREKNPESSTEEANQKRDPSRRIDMKSDRKVRYIVRYANNMMMISTICAC